MRAAADARCFVPAAGARCLMLLIFAAGHAAVTMLFRRLMMIRAAARMLAVDITSWRR